MKRVSSAHARLGEACCWANQEVHHDPRPRSDFDSSSHELLSRGLAAGVTPRRRFDQSRSWELGRVA